MYRRIVFLCLGVLECLTAILTAAFAWGMPGGDDVHDGVARIERVAGQMSGQLVRLRAELRAIREQRPKLRALAESVRSRMETATAGLDEAAGLALGAGVAGAGVAGGGSVAWPTG